MKTKTAWFAALALSASAAPALADEVEVGTFAGLHIFNDDNELGVVDVSSSPSLRNGALFGIRAAYHLSRRLGLEGELGVVPTRVRGERVDVVNLNWRLSGMVHLLDEGRLRPFATLGVGGSTAQSTDTAVLDNDTDVVGLIGLGARFGGPAFGLRLDARAVLPPSSAGDGPTTEWEATLGLYRTFGGAPAPAVAAPAAPAPAAGVDPAGDSDGDHIANADDRCPDQAENVNSHEDDDGCPDADPDGDGDGVTIGDRCPDQAEDKDTFQDEDGCPEPDNDGDGVADAADTCPAELESPNGFKDADGCADEVPAEVQKVLGSHTVAFAGKSLVFDAASKRALDRLAKVMTDLPELNVEVSGPPQLPEAVIAYLGTKGVTAERLSARPGPPTADGARPAVEVRLVPAVTPAQPATEPSLLPRPTPPPAAEPAPQPSPLPRP